MKHYFLLLILMISNASCFTIQSQILEQSIRCKTTRLDAFWIFGNRNKKNMDDSKSNESSSTSSPNQEPSGMGTTASTMENFKQSQELGKRTNALLQDLGSSTVEGVAVKGKVKVFVNGQQRPIGVELDEEYFTQVGAEELSEVLTVAMLDAWDKSMSSMQDKMQLLYSDLGLTSTKS